MASNPDEPQEFIAHDGRGMPVSGETIVIVRFKDGQVSPPRPAHVAGLCWVSSTISPFTCIEAYHVVGGDHG